MTDDVKVIIAERNGTELRFNEEIPLTSANVKYDNTSSGLSADSSQNAIDELASGGGNGVSPGYSAGRSGNVTSGTWLLGPGSVPTNRSFIPIDITNPILSRVQIGTENLNTYTIQIYEHEGDSINLTLLASISVTSSRNGDSGALSIPITSGRQLAFLLSAGSARNITVQAIVKGENS